ALPERPNPTSAAHRGDAPDEQVVSDGTIWMYARVTLEHVPRVAVASVTVHHDITRWLAVRPHLPPPRRRVRRDEHGRAVGDGPPHRVPSRDDPQRGARGGLTQEAGARGRVERGSGGGIGRRHVTPGS